VRIEHNENPVGLGQSRWLVALAKLFDFTAKGYHFFLQYLEGITFVLTPFAGQQPIEWISTLSCPRPSVGSIHSA